MINLRAYELAGEAQNQLMDLRNEIEGRDFGECFRKMMLVKKAVWDIEKSIGSNFVHLLDESPLNVGKKERQDAQR